MSNDGIKIFFAIFDTLDLSQIDIDVPISFSNCVIKNADLVMLKCRNLLFNNCKIDLLNGETITIVNGFDLHDCAIGTVRLTGSDFHGAVQVVKSQISTFVANASIFKKSFLIEESTICRRLSLTSATFNSEAHFKICKFIQTTEQPVFNIDRITAEQNVVISNCWFYGRMNVRNAKVKHELVLQEIKQENFFYVDLRSTSVGLLDDDPSSWPSFGCLALKGFEYMRFGDKAPVDSQSRLDWISRQYLPASHRWKILKCVNYLLGLDNPASPQGKDCREAIVSQTKDINLFLDQIIKKIEQNASSTEVRAALLKLMRLSSGSVPQTYQQVAQALKYNGDGYGANEVMIAWENEVDQKTKPSILRLLWKTFTGYGYKPIKIVRYSSALLIFSWALFHWSMHMIYPLPFPGGEEVIMDNVFDADVPPGYPTFFSLLFTLDVFVPLLDLQQVSHWGIGGDGVYSDFLKIWSNLLTICGWVLVTIGITAASNRIRDY